MTRLGVSYFGNRYLSHAREDLRHISGFCDYIVHTVNEADLTYHKSVLHKIFEESRKLGLEVWVDPWGLGGVFGGESFSKFLLDHRASWQMMSDGRLVPGACLNRPEWRSYMKEWILSVRDMGGQVLFWDEPHISLDVSSELDGVYTCTCEICRLIFRKKFGQDAPPRLTQHAREFRRETLVNYLTEMMAFAKAEGMKNAVCLYSFKGQSEYDLFWNAVASIPSLDIFGSDPYWRWHLRHDPATFVHQFSSYVAETSRKNGKASQIWIQAMRFSAGTEDEIAIAAEAAVQGGANYLAAWSYDGGELLDSVLSENPEAVKKNLEKTFNRLRLRTSV